MNKEMFVNLVWPTLSKAIRDRGFEPSLISNKAMSDSVYILLSPVYACSQSEKQFDDTAIDLLTQFHIPFEDKSDRSYTLIFINLTKLKLWEIKND